MSALVQRELWLKLMELVPVPQAALAAGWVWDTGTQSLSTWSSWLGSVLPFSPLGPRMGDELSLLIYKLALLASLGEFCLKPVMGLW